MKPIFTVEFRARTGELEFEEESVTFDGPEELFAFVAPGGGCEAVPDEVQEIHLAFVPHPGSAGHNPIANLPATLQLGMVFLSGPLTAIVQTLDQLGARAAKGELSAAFMKVIGAGR